MKRLIANFEAMLWPSQQCNQTIHTRETEKKQGKTLEDKRENAPNQQNVERHDLIMKAIATTMRLGS